MNERHIVHTGTEVRDEIAHPFSALAVLFPVPGTFHQRAWVALEQFHFAAGVELLAGAFDELRLVIKRVALAGGAGHEELHDTFGAGGMVQAAVPFGPRPGR